MITNPTSVRGGQMKGADDGEGDVSGGRKKS